VKIKLGVSMKPCKYCGRENDEDATHCKECGTPFDENFQNDTPSNECEAPIKIPLALSVVSYIFFFGGVVSMLQLLGGVALLLYSTVPFKIVYLFQPGIVCLWISRGLRRCSSGWRTCALVLTWMGFFSLAWMIIYHFCCPLKTFFTTICQKVGQ
jgi:hypothetical protein